jgi:hypothetical protein
MFSYLLKYYLIISLAAALPVMIVLTALPDQTVLSVIFRGIRWGGIVGIYLTYRYFSSRDYWVLFQNLELPYLRMLVAAGVLFECSILVIHVWVRNL